MDLHSQAHPPVPLRILFYHKFCLSALAVTIVSLRQPQCLLFLPWLAAPGRGQLLPSPNLPRFKAMGRLRQGEVLVKLWRGRSHHPLEGGTACLTLTVEIVGSPLAPPVQGRILIRDFTTRLATKLCTKQRPCIKRLPMLPIFLMLSNSWAHCWSLPSLTDSTALSTAGTGTRTYRLLMIASVIK